MSDLTNMSKSITIIDKDYIQWIKNLSSRYRRSQIKAAVKVNEEMIRFYWELGRDITEMKTESRWGSGFMKNLSKDLKELNPDATCFSQTNLLYMKNFYRLYQPYSEITPHLEEQIAQQVVEQNQPLMTQQVVEQIQKDMFSVPCEHHKLILDKVKGDVNKALFFINQTLGQFEREKRA